MWPTAILGVFTQYIKSVPLTGKWAQWQPVVALGSIFGLGTLLYIWATPGALSEDWRTFLNADFTWVQAAAGVTQFTSLASQIGVNFGAFKGDSKLILNTNTPAAPAATVATVPSTT